MNKFNWTRNPDFKNILAIDYDKYWEDRGFSINKKLKEREEIILKMIDKKSSVFDIGCGNSLLPVKLKEKGCDVSIGDISPVVLSGFKEKGIVGEKIDLDVIKDFKIKKNFDYIILSEVLEHTRNPEEIIDVLKDNTRNFIITIPNSAYYKFRFSLFFRGRFFTQWVSHPSEHLRFWSHIDFLDWAKAMNLRVESSVPSNGFSFFGLFPKLKFLNKNLLGFQIIYVCRVME